MIQAALDISESEMSYALVMDSICGTLYIMFALWAIGFAGKFSRWTKADTCATWNQPALKLFLLFPHGSDLHLSVSVELSCQLACDRRRNRDTAYHNAGARTKVHYRHYH